MISSHHSGPGQGRFENDGCFNCLSLARLAEQHRIVAKFEAFMPLCDRLEAALAQAGTTRVSLLDPLLHAALATAATEIKAAA